MRLPPDTKRSFRPLYARELKGLLGDGQKELASSERKLLEEEENDDELSDPTDKLRSSWWTSSFRDQAARSREPEAQAMTGLRLPGQFPKDYTPYLKLLAG